jgi:predicted DCC family thiol-disulfide oxidoreductase YuxK
MRDDAPGRHVILYDGVCGLCNRLVRFVLPRDRGRVFRFGPLQGAWARAALARHGRDPGDLDTQYVVKDAGTPAERVLDRAEASLFIVARLTLPWRLLAPLLRVLPRRALDVAYDAVARSRYRVFGRHAACLAPPPDAADRFVGETGDPLRPPPSGAPERERSVGRSA